MNGESGGTRRSAPQVKICGLTRIDQAMACAELGADAVGLVFYPPSPRFIADSTAREICMNLPDSVFPVGVFVNEQPRVVLDKVRFCGLKAVQLHGTETAGAVDELARSGVVVIKTLFRDRFPSLRDSRAYRNCVFLVEGGKGPLPGGNALTWDWTGVRDGIGDAPCILAGGLDAGNVGKAVEEVCPDGVDVSSGVESEPGVKDMARVKSFLETVHRAKLTREPRRIF